MSSYNINWTNSSGQPKAWKIYRLLTSIIAYIQSRSTWDKHSQLCTDYNQNLNNQLLGLRSALPLEKPAPSWVSWIIPICIWLCCRSTQQKWRSWYRQSIRLGWAHIKLKWSETPSATRWDICHCCNNFCPCSPPTLKVAECRERITTNQTHMWTPLLGRIP